jgi:hypothetical protein
MHQTHRILVVDHAIITVPLVHRRVNRHSKLLPLIIAHVVGYVLFWTLYLRPRVLGFVPSDRISLELAV